MICNLYAQSEKISLILIDGFYNLDVIIQLKFRLSTFDAESFKSLIINFAKKISIVLKDLILLTLV